MLMRRWWRRRARRSGGIAVAFVLAVAALCVTTGAARCQIAPPDQADHEWHFDAAIYGWMPAMSGSLEARGTRASFNESFLDTVRKSDTLLGLMGHFEAHHDDLGGIADFLYTKIKFKSAAVGPLTVTPTSEMAIVDFTGAWRLTHFWLDNIGDRSMSIEALAGGRFYSIGNRLDFGGAGGATPPSIDEGKSWVDPVIGLRINTALSPSWILTVRGDVGGFGLGSDFAWQTAAVLGYRIRLLNQNAVLAVGYRALSWNFSHGQGPAEFRSTTTMHGPLIGLDFQF